MTKEMLRKGIGLILLVSIIALPWFTPFQLYLSIPNQLQSFTNSDDISLPVMGKSVSLEKNGSQTVRHAADMEVFQSSQSGNSEYVYKVGKFPVKKVNVSVYDEFSLIPGGQSIGINLNTNGVLVVGHHLVQTSDGEVSPGENAEIKVGDNIIKINDQNVTKMDQITPIVKQAGENNQDLQLKIKRGDKTVETKLTPQYDTDDESYRIGLYIRDSAAGIGTLTFVHPESKKYGALGHVISDMDTRKPVDIDNGSIVRSNIKEIQKGEHGVPGEKKAQFLLNDVKLGNITKNTPFGIFGNLEDDVKDSRWNKPMPIALPNQVKEGKAKILTVINGEEVEAFDVEIVNSIDQNAPATKGIILKITDKRLLDATGGIVQGMSGSPIIQDGKIIGAVTHVFVNDPTSGYGVHIEWMLNEAGIDIYEQKKEAS
ncbi:Stage IV sporulation protein B [Gracilibacillus halophilus YIM-C55.5]|uniref:Stage IV sporulation protein B n=1 Tax=Gracilibacillus halophilus YIM-C55.5 TaxID=1308866 RepID=N4WWG7_9BACI|nr:SpoIVB peptidase [Gracilibacillus halophilus]ENH97421.1 Stage IV sporulation protein B [Gracilibacillus halophilus YIM-C55.5]